eukprot:9497410-Pyramimonas_sp.AAC.1
MECLSCGACEYVFLSPELAAPPKVIPSGALGRIWKWRLDPGPLAHCRSTLLFTMLPPLARRF